MKWLEGKKTLIGAGALAAVGAAAYWQGYIDGVTCAELAAAALIVWGLGDKADRYAKLLMGALEKAKEKHQPKPPGPAGHT